MIAPDENNSEYPKRARVDDGNEPPRDLAERVYSNEFLSALGAQFGFDALKPDTAEELRHIALCYIAGRRDENRPPSNVKDRRKFIALKKTTDDYLSILERQVAYDIESDIAWALSQVGRPKFDDKKAGIYYRQLLLLLDMMSMSTGYYVSSLASRGGRPKNVGLVWITPLAKKLWTAELGRKFTIDYHKGAGLTPAFEFMKALVQPLDDVTDKQIITAMRLQKRNGPDRRSRG
jgi:hypothetical protein